MQKQTFEIYVDILVHLQVNFQSSFINMMMSTQKKIRLFNISKNYLLWNVGAA